MDDMTSAIMDQVGPWTEQNYLALGESTQRVELFDGSLIVTPAPTPRHQYISSELTVMFRRAARKSGLLSHDGVNVRLQPGRIVIPDVVITSPVNDRESIIDSTAVRLVCEIVSPANASNDKLLKMQTYAAAGIPWYLLIDQDDASLHLYELAGTHYVVHSVTPFGKTLQLTEPIEILIDTAELLPEQ